MSANATAFCAGALALVAAADLLAGWAGRALERTPVLTGAVRSLADVVTRAGREGRDPDAAERRRLLACGAVASLAGVTVLMGPVAGVLAAAAAPAAASRLLSARRARYRRAVDAAAAAVAVTLADALSGGHSLRGALAAAATSLQGPAGHELRRVAAQLELGAATDDALEAMRSRIASPRIDVLVAGAMLQRSAGGDLAALFRQCARSFEDDARLVGEVRAATAQARFTGLVVVGLPVGGAGIAELASPGFIAGLAAFPLSGWFVGMAIAMQAGAAFAIRRIARVQA